MWICLNITAKKEKSRKKYFYIRKTAAKGATVILTAVVILTAPAVKGSICRSARKSYSFLRKWYFYASRVSTVNIYLSWTFVALLFSLWHWFYPWNKNYGQNPRRHVVFINSNQLDGQGPRLLVTHSPELVPGSVWPMVVCSFGSESVFEPRIRTRFKKKQILHLIV